MKEKKIPLIDYKTLGLSIHRLRKERGFSQAEMAKKVSCSVTHYSRIESGYRPSLDLLAKIARVLCVSMDELLGVPTQMNPYLKEIEGLLVARPSQEQQFVTEEVSRLYVFMHELEDKHMYHPFTEYTAATDAPSDAPASLTVAETADEYSAR